MARGAAHEANALRVGGDLPAAERGFVALRQRLAEHPLADPAVAAEIDSLEASLSIAQRRLDLAETLLQRAALALRAVGDRRALARVEIKLANLHRTAGRPAEVLRLTCAVLDALDPHLDPQLFLCATTAQCNALCDLDRHDEAGSLLAAHLDLYEASEDPSAGALYRCLDGRVALGRQQLERAEEAFRTSRDAMLTLGRSYDASLITLYLGEALLATGKTRELRELARDLVPAFAAQGVEGETLAALRLFARAAATEQLSLVLLRELRSQVLAPGAGVPLPPN